MAVDESQHQHFVTTHWSVVLAAGQVDTARSLQALEELCRTYWFPLYAYVRRRGYQPEDAQDFTQGFFLRLIEKQSLRQADSTRGKFRSFLLVCLKNFLAKERERASAQRRGGGRPLIPLDGTDAQVPLRVGADRPTAAELVGFFLRELGQLYATAFDVQPGDCFVEVFWQTLVGEGV